MKKNQLSLLRIFITLFCGLGLAQSVSAATFSASPSTGSYTVGQTITVTVKLNSSGQAINAGEATVTFTSASLQFVSVSSSGSIFKYWPIDPAIRGSSSVVFSGGLPSPGYTGSSGTVVRITFTAKAAGTATVAFSGAKILANDGLGTDLYTGQGSASYTISSSSKPAAPSPTPEVPDRPTPSVSSSSHPDQSTWYRDAVAKITWTKPSGIQGVSYTVNQEKTTVPDEVVDSTGTTTELNIPSDGTWYLHLRGKYSTGWSSTVHYALHLDRTPPEVFTPIITQDRGLSDPSPVLTFSTTDSVSTIAKFVYAVDGGKGLEATSPVELVGIAAGAHTIIVTAFDQAGNIREGKVSLTVEGYASPTITYISTPLLLLDPLVIRGTANVNDTITLYVNDQVVGQAVAGPGDAAAAPGVTLKVPWSFTTDKIFRPGTFTVTATATSTSGQVSATTDPKEVRVNGKALTLNGRAIATISVVTPLIFFIILLLLLISGVMAKLVMSLIILHRRQDIAEEELETLRAVNKRQSINKQQLESALVQIEQDLEGIPSRRASSKRRTKKRSR